MFSSCSANGQVSMAGLRVFRWGLLVKSAFFFIKWKMSCEQVHRATGEAVLQFGRLRSLPCCLLQSDCSGTGQISDRKRQSGICRVPIHVLPGQQNLMGLVPGGLGRLLGSWLWRAEGVICETGRVEAWLFTVKKG